MANAAHALTAAQAQQMNAALRLLNSGSVDDALKTARRLVAASPRAPEAQQFAGICLARKGNAVEAEQAFRRALALAPENPHVLANLATLLRRIGRREEAVQAWRRAVAIAPDSAQAWLDLGLTELGLQHLPQAREALQRATALQPGSALAWHGLGDAQRASDDPVAAETAYRKAVAADAGYGPAWANLASVLRQSGRSAEAIECLEQARKAGRQDPGIEDALVGALVDTGQVEAALERARRLLRTHPLHVPGHVTLAHLLWEHGPALAPGEDPLETFRAAALAMPQEQALQLAFVRFLLVARQTEEVLQRVRELRAQADHPDLMRLHADALEMQGRSDEAGALYAQLHRALGSSDPALLNAYVRHLLKSGQWQAAERIASEATRISPTNQEAWAYLGTAWRLLDDPREFWLWDYERLITMVEVQPPPGYANMPEFLAALTATLEPMHRAAREPVQQSLRGGSQTPGRLFGRQEPVIAATHAAMLQAVEAWLAGLPSDANHPFLRYRKRSVRMSGSWSVRLWSSGSHVNHIHSEGWMSSAFYVALPPSVQSTVGDDTAGHIQFGQPPRELGLDLPPRRVLRPEPGRLALFPSCMWHGTVPFVDTQPRITIAFDMLPAD